MPLSQAEFSHLIPHAGKMVLIDKVLDYDEMTINCYSISHLLPENPLRRNTGLPAVCGIEYAAQAIAIHGGLLAASIGQRAALGYLAGVRNCSARIERLDALDAALYIRAERLGLNSTGLLYNFSLCAAGSLLLEGQLSVFFLEQQ